MCHLYTRQLYILLFLHQTTTLLDLLGYGFRLYILLFLHQTTTENELLSGCWMLYILLFLHQTTTLALDEHKKAGCISYYSYIKPQPELVSLLSVPRCISYYSYIKPQRIFVPNESSPSCISYYSYIKPQHFVTVRRPLHVVYLTIPTSNHNTSRYNYQSCWLYILLFLHQTTTCEVFTFFSKSCISYYSYIKPQPIKKDPRCKIVVYLTIPTSNHNKPRKLPSGSWLYILLFLHQTTTYSLAIK